MRLHWLLALSLVACGENTEAPVVPVDAGPLADAAPPSSRWHCEVDPTEPVVSGFVAPSVVRGPDGYTMWVGGFSATTSYVYATTSPDGIVWGPTVRDPSRNGFFADVLESSAIFYNPVFAPSGDEQLQLWRAPATGLGTWGAATLVLDRGGPGALDEDAVFSPSVVSWGGRTWIWYSAGRRQGPPYLTIALATSDDGVIFTRWPDPVLEVGPAGGFDDTAVSRAGVVHDGRRFVMFYQGAHRTAPNALRTCIGVATSEDGIHWERDPEPVLTPEGDGWRRYAVMDPEPLVEDGGITVWFDGLGPDGSATIGRARCMER